MIWLPFNDTFQAFILAEKGESGILIEVVLAGKRTHFLIGDINPTGASTGASSLPMSTLVLRYKRLWSR